MEQHTPGNDRSRLKKAEAQEEFIYNIEAEQAVLSALLIDSSAPEAVADQLSPEVFYDRRHQVIYQVIEELYQQGKAIDIISVNHQLQKKKLQKIAEAPAYLVILAQKVFSTAYLEYHAKILLESYFRRQIYKAGSLLMQKAYEADIDAIDVLNDATKIINDTVEKRIENNIKRLSKELYPALKQLQVDRQALPTGLPELDKLLNGGFKAGELYVLAARPSMGKTAMMLTFALHLAIEHAAAVLIFSLEMTVYQIIQRLVSMQCHISVQHLYNSKLTNEFIHKLNGIKKLENAEIYIDDTSSLHIKELRAKARKMHKKHAIGCIMVDYLQLCDGGNGKNTLREQEIATISKDLKSIAKELNVPVIVLSQLNRSVETRQGSKRPVLSDLRESGAIEQDADVVFFLYRPEYYGYTSWEDSTPCQGQAELIVSKNRNGSTGAVRMHYHKEYTLFSC
ncbi:MAG: replicative DNA helicase [Thermaurantimonas sp.]|uniref:replicative DNA helicase n=1 Tax=Thermaurantimonas sp. TaxID=2681568 RepID=UPI003918E3AC